MRHPELVHQRAEGFDHRDASLFLRIERNFVGGLPVLAHEALEGEVAHAVGLALKGDQAWRKDAVEQSMVVVVVGELEFAIRLLGRIGSRTGQGSRERPHRFDDNIGAAIVQTLHRVRPFVR